MPLPRKDPRFIPEIFTAGELLAKRYRVKFQLSVFAEGILYLAHDQKSLSDVFIRAIFPGLLQSNAEQSRFVEQMKQAKKVVHPHLLPIQHVGEVDGRFFIVHDFFKGSSFREPPHSLPIFDFFMRLAQVMQDLHKTTWHGLLHPDHILLAEDGFSLLGLKLRSAIPHRPHMSIMQLRSQNLPFIAPEVRLGSATIDHRADIYSLGMLLLFVKTNRVVEASNARAFSECLQSLPLPVQSIVRRSVSSYPEARFSTMQHFMNAIEEYLSPALKPPAVRPVVFEGAVAARRPNFVSMLKGRFGYAAALFSGLFVVLATLFLGIRTVQMARHVPEERHVHTEFLYQNVQP